MQKWYFPNLELQELEIYEQFPIIKIGRERDFDDLTALAAQFCDAPVAGIFFLEKEKAWLKSLYGIAEDQLEPSNILWDDTLQQCGVYSINKTSELGKFSFFAGIPLFSKEGIAIGILFVLDFQPSELNLKQENTLQVLARQILNLLAYRKQYFELERVHQILKQKNQNLEKFASVVSHDIKSPLANIISLTELLKAEFTQNPNLETQEYLNFLIQSSYSLRNYVDGILTFYRSDYVLEKDKENVNLSEFFKNITRLYQINKNVEIKYPSSGFIKNVNKAALTQIFLNLLSNALKYNKQKVRKVEITFQESAEHYHFEIKDNGNGIAEKDYAKIFDLFTTLENQDRDGNSGSGIGLATVKKMLEHMNGDISVDSRISEGSSFKFRIKRT